MTLDSHFKRKISAFSYKYLSWNIGFCWLNLVSNEQFFLLTDSRLSSCIAREHNSGCLCMWHSSPNLTVPSVVSIRDNLSGEGERDGHQSHRWSRQMDYTWKFSEWKVELRGDVQGGKLRGCSGRVEAGLYALHSPVRLADSLTCLINEYKKEQQMMNAVFRRNITLAWTKKVRDRRDCERNGQLWKRSRKDLRQGRSLLN